MAFENQAKLYWLTNRSQYGIVDKSLAVRLSLFIYLFNLPKNRKGAPTEPKLQ
jgi:hypothetical protein